MNFQKAQKTAEKWIQSNPQELEPTEVESVLKGLEFKLLGKNSDHTTFRWQHKKISCDYFLHGIIKISVNHKKSAKSAVLIGSVKPLLKALKIYFEKE